MHMLHMFLYLILFLQTLAIDNMGGVTLPHYLHATILILVSFTKYTINISTIIENIINNNVILEKACIIHYSYRC